MAQPQVDFYVLSSDDPAARLRFACRLAEKAWARRHRVRVQLEPGGELETFDRMLWTYSDRSFVPHRRAGVPEPVPPPARVPVVLADTAEADPADGDVVINLAAAVPHGFESYGRIAEIVDAEAQRRGSGRERFRFYRERGLSPATHEMGSEP